MTYSTTKKQRTSALVIATTAMTITHEIKSGDLDSANASVLLFASTNGDASVPMLLGKIPKTGLAQLLVATATLPSAINAELVKASDFAAAFAELPKTWSSRTSHAESRIDVQELVLGIAMQADDDGNLIAPGKYLTALEKIPETAKILAWWLWPNAEEITGFVKTRKWGNPIFLGNGQGEAEEELDSEEGLGIAQTAIPDDEDEISSEAKVMAMFHAGRRDMRISSDIEGDWQHFVEVMKRKAPDHLSRILGNYSPPYSTQK